MTSEFFFELRFIMGVLGWDVVSILCGFFFSYRVISCTIRSLESSIKQECQRSGLLWWYCH